MFSDNLQIVNKEYSVSSFLDSSGRLKHSPTEEPPQKGVTLDLKFKISPISFDLGDRAEDSEVERPLFLVFSNVRPRSSSNELRQVLEVFSESRKKGKTLRKIFLKFLWDSVSTLELEVLLLLALEVNEIRILEAFRAFSGGLSLTLLRARINAYSRLKGLKPFSRREFLSSKGFLFSIAERTFFDQLPKHKSYSGWRRHQNDQGSLRPVTHPYEFSEPIIPNDFDEEIIFSLREFLSVGRLSPRGNESPLKMAIIRAETEIFLNFLKEELNEISSIG